MERFDIIIIGTGPAGVSAAITARIRNKRILLLGKGTLSDKVRRAGLIKNYTGLPDITGEQLVAALKNHLDAMDIQITDKRVTAVYAMGKYFTVQTAENEMIEADSVILATGVVTQNEIPGEAGFLGRGVSYCATCDAPLYKGKNVTVVGYNKDAEAEANFLAEIAGSVSYIPMYIDDPGVTDVVKVIREKPLSVQGGMKATAIETDKGIYEADGIFIFRDSISPAQLVPGLKTEDGHVAADLQMRTNIAGLFVCGDATGKPYQYIKAAGQGNVAALSAVSWLDQKDK